MPIKPIKTPVNCFLKNSSLKKIILIINVNKGVNDTITPATALEISVSAKANKQLGKKVPINAEKATYLILFFGIWFNLERLKGAIKIAVIIILKDPN